MECHTGFAACSTGKGTASDGGTKAGILGTLLTWLATKKSEVYVVGTCNDVNSLPPELIRPGRFDGVFFLDLPSTEQRQMIWQIYREKYRIPKEERTPNDHLWTGAEIEACCRNARMQGKPLLEMAKYIVPVGLDKTGHIVKTREFADGTLIDANVGGPYSLHEYDQKRKQEKSGVKSTPRAKDAAMNRIGVTKRPVAQSNN
jgi:hypothetical protein